YAILWAGVGGLVIDGGMRDNFGAVFADHPHPILPDSREVRAPRDERHLLAGRGKPAADITADRAGADDRDLHAAIDRPVRARHVRNTKIASNAAAKFITAVATKTPDQPKLEAAIKLAKGTRRDATPFAT